MGSANELFALESFHSADASCALQCMFYSGDALASGRSAASQPLFVISVRKPKCREGLDHAESFRCILAKSLFRCASLERSF